jgi:hypothetical protein
VYLSEFLELSGDHKRAASIRINNPVVAYVSDKNRQDWYFNNPANKKKTFDDLRTRYMLILKEGI